jgi:hypothetical protein
MDRAARIQDLLSSFETISAELDAATDDQDIAWLRAELLAIEADLAELQVVRST